MADWSNFGVGVAGAAAGMGLNLVGNTISGLIDNAFYKRNLGLQVGAQKELIDYQNAYNSPSAQMQRLLEAGMNPNLVYGSAAPAGISGNASSPSGAFPGRGFNTADIVSSMLHLKQMECVNSQINLQNAEAEKARADARFTNSQADRYNELVDIQINEANARINKLASDINVNQSTIQFQTAQKLLADAETAYKNSEIGLQEFRKQQIIAQTALFASQNALTKTQDYYLDVEGQMSVLALEYEKLFYSGNRMKNLATAEYQANLKTMRLQAEKAAATLGIEGNAVTKWTDWILSQLGKFLGGAGTAAIAGNAVKNRTVTVIKK